MPEALNPPSAVAAPEVAPVEKWTSSSMDVVQIFATVGLLVATVVLVIIEYHRWRPVITLGVRYMERNGEWHAVLEVRNMADRRRSM